jgi:hypothetical protein
MRSIISFLICWLIGIVVLRLFIFDFLTQYLDKNGLTIIVICLLCVYTIAITVINSGNRKC